MSQSFGSKGNRDIEKMKTLLYQNEDNENFFIKLTALLNKKADDVKEETANILRDCDSLKRHIEGYERYLVQIQPDSSLEIQQN